MLGELGFDGLQSLDFFGRLDSDYSFAHGVLFYPVTGREISTDWPAFGDFPQQEAVSLVASVGKSFHILQFSTRSKVVVELDWLLVDCYGDSLAHDD